MLWWKELSQLDWFQGEFAERYLSLQPLIINLYENNELGENRIDKRIASMKESIANNYNNLWPVNVRAYYGEMIAKPTYEANVEYLREWIAKRNEWILSQIEQGGQIIRIIE